MPLRLREISNLMRHVLTSDPLSVVGALEGVKYLGGQSNKFLPKGWPPENLLSEKWQAKKKGVNIGSKHQYQSSSIWPFLYFLHYFNYLGRSRCPTPMLSKLLGRPKCPTPMLYKLLGRPRPPCFRRPWSVAVGVQGWRRLPHRNSLVLTFFLLFVANFVDVL